MPLNWNVSNIENHEVITTAPKLAQDEPDKWHPVTDAIVWYSMICGFNRITKDNVDKVFERVALFEGLNPMLTYGAEREPVYITREDIENHIGFSSNASSMTDAEFRKHFVTSALDEAKRKMAGKPSGFNAIAERFEKIRAEREAEAQ